MVDRIPEEVCPECGKTKQLMEVSNLEQIDGSYKHRRVNIRKMCNDCFMKKVWVVTKE